MIERGPHHLDRLITHGYLHGGIKAAWISVGSALTLGRPREGRAPGLQADGATSHRAAGRG